MPSKESYVIMFLAVAAITFGVQYFVFRQLRRVIRRDFPAKAERWTRIAKWVFILMNIPVAYLFFRKPLNIDIAAVTQVMLYPYTIWQFLMLMWLMILLPVTAYRLIKTKVFAR